MRTDRTRCKCSVLSAHILSGRSNSVAEAVFYSKERDSICHKMQLSLPHLYYGENATKKTMLSVFSKCFHDGFLPITN